MKNFMSNVILIAVSLLWIIGVDSMPVMKVLGFPLFILAFCFWVKHSTGWKKLSRFIDDGLGGKFE